MRADLNPASNKTYAFGNGSKPKLSKPEELPEGLASDSFVLCPRTAEETAYDALSGLAAQGQSLTQIKEHLGQEHSPGKIAKHGFLAALGGALGGATLGAVGTALAATGGVVIAATLLVGGVFASAGLGLPLLTALPAAVGAAYIPSNLALLSHLPTITLGIAGLGGALAAAEQVRMELKEKRIDQSALAKMESQSGR